ncbi:MAG: Spx/MgsR family RNA polymerase-binding regulatory protein [Balneolales bacterium]
MLEVFGIKNCDTIKKTRKWLEENSFEYTFRDVKSNPLSPNELACFVKKVGLEGLVNKRGRTWKMLGLSDKNLNDNDLFEVLLEKQTMIRRPVLKKDEAVLVGFDEDAVTVFLEDQA